MKFLHDLGIVIPTLHQLSAALGKSIQLTNEKGSQCNLCVACGDVALALILLAISAVHRPHDFPLPPPDANAMTGGDFPRCGT